MPPTPNNMGCRHTKTTKQGIHASLPTVVLHCRYVFPIYKLLSVKLFCSLVNYSCKSCKLWTLHPKCTLLLEIPVCVGLTRGRHLWQRVHKLWWNPGKERISRCHSDSCLQVLYAAACLVRVEEMSSWFGATLVISINFLTEYLYSRWIRGFTTSWHYKQDVVLDRKFTKPACLFSRSHFHSE